MSVPTRTIICRVNDCRQVLAVWGGASAGWRVLGADILINDKGRADLICPACKTRRRFDDRSIDISAQSVERSAA
jgi:hypothetical protein